MIRILARSAILADFPREIAAEAASSHDGGGVVIGARLMEPYPIENYENRLLYPYE